MEKEKLQFKRVTKDVELQIFDCGVPSINGYVKNSYFPTIIQHAYAYSIIGKGKILGYYMVLFRDIKMEHFPEEIADFDSGVKDGLISAVHIRYIAIDKRYQRHKIGTVTLQSIIKQVRDLAVSWPIRVITIDAREDLVSWYENEGFVKMKINPDEQDGITQAMFFNCCSFTEELTQYLSDLV